VCFGTRDSDAETGEPIEMSFGGLTYLDPRKRVLDACQDRTNQLAAASSDNSAMRPFAKVLDTFVVINL